MSKVEKFEDLTVWQDSRNLVNHIYQQFSTLKDWGFRDQIQRASISVMNNIAEGFERNSDKDFRRFLIIAKASCGKFEVCYISLRISIISQKMKA